MGWIGLMFGIVMIGNHHVNMEYMGPAISVAFLPILYGYFIRLITTGLEKIKNE
jgi:flagellar motor component MotA